MTELRDPIPKIGDALAEAEGTESITLEPPRAEIIDPEAVETLLEGSSASGLEIQFAYRGHDVVVDGSGRIQVD